MMFHNNNVLSHHIYVTLLFELFFFFLYVHLESNRDIFVSYLQSFSLAPNSNLKEYGIGHEDLLDPETSD